MARLPPGFRFHPTDIELIMYYLRRKVLGKKLHFEAISELNIYKFSPWDLPDKSCLKNKDLEWYFFCPRERKYASGERIKRGTENGFWKTTGKDRSVVYKERVVGMVKTLVFHEGNAPHGKRTDWVVYEYRMDDKNLSDAGVAQDTYVLYKVFKKNGLGPKNGAQYGAPFDEEEWDDDDDLGIPAVSLPSDGLSPVVLTVPENQISAALNTLVDPVCASGLSLGEAGPSVQPSNNILLDGLSSSMVTDVFDPRSTSGRTLPEQGPSSAGPSANDIPYSPSDDIDHLLAAFTEDTTFLPNEKENDELGKLGHGRDNVAVPHLDGNDPFNRLENLSNWAEVTGGGVNFSGGQSHNINNMVPQDDMAFLELNDLDPPLNFSVDSGDLENIPGSSCTAYKHDASEHNLTGISSTQYSPSGDLGQIFYNVNFPSSQTVFQGFSQVSLLPNSSCGHVDSTNVFLTGNAYGNILSQGYAAGNNLHSISHRQPEEHRDAAGNQERGMQQGKFFSRLQLLLESFPFHPASVAEHLAPSNSAYGGSSIHVKAEVTSRLDACTKDALSVMLGESTYDYSCWWNLHGAEFWKKAADCSGCVVSYFGLTSAFMWILMFSLSLMLGCHSWKCVSFTKMIACLNSCTKLLVLSNFSDEFVSQFCLRTKPFSLVILHWFAIFCPRDAHFAETIMLSLSPLCPVLPPTPPPLPQLHFIYLSF